MQPVSRNSRQTCVTTRAGDGSTGRMENGLCLYGSCGHGSQTHRY